MSLEELKLDAEEFTELLIKAKRTHVRELLIQAKAEVDRKIVALEVKARLATEHAANGTNPKRYFVELTEYAWDQSDNFVKLFVTINNVQSCAEDAVTLKLTDNSMQLSVDNLNGKDYGLTINNLLEPINVEKSYRKVKNDMVAIYLKKMNEGKQWSNLNTILQRLQQKQVTEMSKDSDNPESALVNIMKKMYNEGDSKTKQMIAKAWTESQEKSRNSKMDFM